MAAATAVRVSVAVLLVAVLLPSLASALPWTQAGGPLTKTGFVIQSLPSSGSRTWTMTLAQSAPTSAVFTPDGKHGFFGGSTGALVCFTTPPLSKRRHYLVKLHVEAPGPPPVKWTYHGTGSAASTPAVSDDGTTVFYATNDDSNAYVYGVDVSNGDLVWPSILSLSNQFQGVSGAITYYKDSNGEYLFMGTTAGLLAMVDATTGLLVSSDYLSSGSTVFGASSIDPTSSTVFFTSQDMNVYAGTISGGSAMTAWSQLVISGNLIGTTPVIETSNNVLYVTTEGLQGGGAGGALCSVDMSGSHTVTVLHTAASPVFTSPVVAAPDRILFGDSAGTVYCVNPANNGTLLWQTSLGDSAVDSMGVTDGATAVFTTHDGTMWGLKVSSGDVLWSTSLGASIQSSPAFANGQVIVGNSDGTFVGFDTDLMWLEIVVGVIILLGAVIGCLGYRFYLATVHVLAIAGFFPIALVLLEHFTHLKLYENCLIAGGAAIAVALLIAFVRVLGPGFLVTLFCIFAANDVLVALNQSYSSLGLLLIPIFAGSMVVFLPLAFFARTKKLACLLGISAVGATLMVDGAVFYVTDPPREYVGAAYGGAFLLCMFVQMCTGRGQRHLTAAQQDRYREEQALGAVSGDAAYTPLAADALESGGAPVGGAGGVGAGGSVGYAALPRQSNEQVFGANDRFRGDEFDFGGAYTAPVGHSDVVLPGQRAGMASMHTSQDQSGERFTVTFEEGKLGMGLTVPHDPFDAPSCAVVKRFTPGGQAEKRRVRVGDYVVRVGQQNTPAAVPYDRVMSLLKPPLVQYPLMITLFRPYTNRSLAVDRMQDPPAQETTSQGSGGLLGGW